MDIEKLNVRGLTRGEIRGLKKEKVDLKAVLGMEDEEREEALDRIIKAACPECNPDNLTPGEAVKLYTRIIMATYMSQEELKNSDSPQS